MADNLFAPPSNEELEMFAPPSPEELEAHRPGLLTKVGHNIATTAQNVLPESQAALDLGGEALNTGLDTARGIGQGLLMGGADELGGAISALGEAAYNKFNPTDTELSKQGFNIQQPGLPELYRKNQQDIQKEFEGSAERSPVMNTIGQIGGGITSGSAVGGLLGIGGEAATGSKRLLDIARNEGKLKALGELGLRAGKSYKEALPLILGESALSSKQGGLLNSDERGKLGEDVLGGALFGIPAVLGMQAATDIAGPLAAEGASRIKNKIQGVVEDTPLLRQMKVAYGYGKEGINPKSQAQTLNTDLGVAQNLTQLDNQRSLKLMNEIYAAESTVGKGVSDSLQKATAAGKTVNIDPEIKQSLSQVQALAEKYPEIASNPRATQIYQKILTPEGSNITPLEAKDLIDYMDAYIGKFKSSTNTTPAEQGILSNLYQTRQKFSNNLKIAIPEYGQAAERYQQFRRLVPETIIAGERPVNITQGESGFRNVNDEEKKVFDQLKKLNQGTTRSGDAAQPVKESFVNTIKGLKTFEQQEAERKAKGIISDSAFSRNAEDIEREIKQNSDDAVARGTMDALQPSAGVGTTLGKAIAGVGGTGQSMSLSGANIAGRAARGISRSTEGNPIAKVARSVYEAPHESVLALSQKLKSAPGLEKYGESLEKALSSTDSNRRNQVLFTIMQNPNARLFVNDEHENEEPQQ